MQRVDDARDESPSRLEPRPAVPRHSPRAAPPTAARAPRSASDTDGSDRVDDRLAAAVDAALHARDEAVARRIAEHRCEPRVDRRLGAASARSLRPAVVIACGTEGDDALRVARRRRAACVSTCGFDRQRLLVGDRHRRRRRASRLPCTIWCVPSASSRSLTLSARSAASSITTATVAPVGGRRAAPAASRRRARRCSVARPSVGSLLPRRRAAPRRRRRRARRPLRCAFVVGAAARGPPGIREPQRPDELAEQRIAQPALDAVAVQRGERLVARQALQDARRARVRFESSVMSNAPVLVIRHEAAAQDRRGRGLTDCDGASR